MNNKVHVEVIRQLANMLEQLNVQQYSGSLSVLNGSSISQHTRHIIEFYTCLLSGAKNGIIDYDARQRSLLLETDLNYTFETLQNVIEGIENIEDINLPLHLAINYGIDDQHFAETTFLRELVYLIEHSIHHYALIRIGIQENFHGIEIPKNFGVAYSTVQYRENHH
jgi:hypothetical protein